MNILQSNELLICLRTIKISLLELCSNNSLTLQKKIIFSMPPNQVKFTDVLSDLQVKLNALTIFWYSVVIFIDSDVVGQWNWIIPKFDTLKKKLKTCDSPTNVGYSCNQNSCLATRSFQAFILRASREAYVRETASPRTPSVLR